jgi:hypothetical protein
MRNELRPTYISTVKEKFEKESILDLDRRDLIFSVGEISTQIESFVEALPVFKNEFLRADVPADLQEGQNIFIKIGALNSPANSDLEYHLSSNLDGEFQEVSIKRRGLKWAIFTPPLRAGNHNLTVNLFVQNVRLAKALEVALEKDEKTIFFLRRRLERETNQDSRDKIIQEIEKLELSVISLKRQLQDGRAVVGEALVVNLTVN